MVRVWAWAVVAAGGFAHFAWAAGGPATGSSLKGKSSPARAEEHQSPDARFTWAEGENHLTVHNRSKSYRLKLPPVEAGASRKVLFADRGDFFCLVDEIFQEVGLHLESVKGAKAAKATVVSSGLTLMDAAGRTLWTKALREQHVVGRAGASPLRMSEKGALAVLLQDSDPYQKARPLLMVYDARGGERLRLDYLDWRHIDEFALSGDGQTLVVRGFGRIADHETWDPAVGYYPLGKKKGHWVKSIARASDQRLLKSVTPDGRVCCVEEGESWYAFEPSGEKTALSAAEARRQFGLIP